MSPSQVHVLGRLGPVLKLGSDLDLEEGGLAKVPAAALGVVL